MRGYVGDCACTCGGSGGQGRDALLSYEVTACLCLGRRLQPAHPQTRGACPVTRRSNRRCATRTSTRSAFLAWLLRQTPNPIEPPWYGPVCPVVWEGWSRKAPPYPDQRNS